MNEEMRVIRILGWGAGGLTAFDGQFVVEYDPSRDGVEPGTGRPMFAHLVTTPDIDKAARFTVGEAFELWRQVDPRRPIRSDGKPNRPLCAFTVEIARASEFKTGETNP